MTKMGGRKITVAIQSDLLERAQKVNANITETVCMGLKLVAAAHAFEGLREIRGKVRFSHTLAESKSDQ